MAVPSDRVRQGFELVVSLQAADRSERLLAEGFSDNEVLEVLALVDSYLRRPNFLEVSDSAEAPSGSRRSGSSIGSWKVKSFLGAGGMGEIYEVERDTSDFVQRGALKLLQRSSERHLERFERERRILAALEHANIARIIDGGSERDGSPFIVMELVQGQPINQFADNHGLDQRARVALFLQLCAAVLHAHSRLVLHRDIKPGNVLVTGEADVKLLDFGVSTGIDEEANDRIHPVTRRYCAPEQRSGQALTTATDLYALGCVLADLVSDEEGRVEDKDIRAIIERCRENDPQDRYQGVGELIEELRRWDRGETVSARSGGWAYQASKFVKRNPVAVLFAALFAFSLSGGLILSLRQADRALASERLAERARIEQEFEARTLQGYATVLQTLYGRGGEDGELIDPRLIDDAVDSIAADAALRFQGQSLDDAFSLYSMAQVMMFRYRFDKAINYLEPLAALSVDTDIAEALYFDAMSDLARSYVETGRVNEATELTRRLIDEREARNLLFDLGHVQDSQSLAALTNDPSDQERAIRVATETVAKWEAKGASRDDISWLYNQIGSARFARGEIDEAISAFEASFQYADRSVVRSLSDITTATNLAQFQIYFARDGAAPLEYLADYLGPALEDFGAGETHAFIHGLIAEASILEGDWQRALAASEAGRPYLSENRNYRDGWYYNHIRMSVRALAQLGRAADGRRMFDKALEEFAAEEGRADWQFAGCQMIMMDGYLSVMEGDTVTGLATFNQGIDLCRDQSSVGWDNERVIPSLIVELQSELDLASR